MHINWLVSALTKRDGHTSVPSGWPRHWPSSLLFQTVSRKTAACPQQLSLPTPRWVCLKEPSHSKEWGCKVPLQDNCVSGRNHTRTLDEQQAALLLPANRINLNAHRHSWAKSKHQAETKLHHLMARLWHAKEEKPRPCPSSPLEDTSSNDRQTSEKPGHPVLIRAMGRRAPGLHGPGVLAADGQEISFWSSSNSKVSYKGWRRGSVVNTTKKTGSSGSAVNQLTVTQCSAEPVVHPNHRKQSLTPKRKTSTHFSNRVEVKWK